MSSETVREFHSLMLPHKAKVNGEQEIFWVEKGSGIPLVLCHGWPEIWYCWRHQIEHLSSKYRVIAVDLRGFGQSSCPADIEDYRMECITADLIGLLDYLSLPQAVFVGHDWGGAVVWAMAFHFPQRVRAVASINTPYQPSNPKKNPMINFGQLGTPFNYQLYFQTPGVAEAELESNLRRTFSLLFRSSRPSERIVSSDPSVKLSTSNVTERGGMLVGMPINPQKSYMLSDEELEYYVENYTRTGFRGPLNWYRNVEANWKWNLPTSHVVLSSEIPALMVTTGKDTVLRPSMTKHMERFIPHLDRAHIEECAHWTQMECPDQLNVILENWLATISVRQARL